MDNKETLSVLLAIQVATLVSVGLNIVFARQILSFVFLVFVPGFLIFQFFKSDKTTALETAVFSVGLSLTFLMFSGLLLNTVLPVLGYANPLSTFDVTVFIGAVTLALTGILLIYPKQSTKPNTPKASFKVTPITLFFICLPFLTIIGAELAAIFSYTGVLMVLTALIPILALFIFSKRMVPQRSYPMILFTIAFFLLIGTSLISNYVLGTDVQVETYFARVTSVNSFWDASFAHPYNGMLSVTILPTIMAKFMNFDVAWLFKVVFPLIYALVPLTLFMAYRKQTNAIVAFLAVFFFMSMDTFFLQMLGLARQMIAEVFFGLIILLLVDNKLDVVKKRILFFVFAASLVVSHYSLGYILVFYVLLALLIARFFKRPDDQSKSIVTPLVAGGFIAFTLGWDLLVAPAAFESLETFATYVFEQIQSLAPAPGVSGLMPVYLSPLHDVSKYLFLFLQGLIVVGFVGLLIRRKSSRFNKEYAAMTVASFAVLLMTLVVPSFGSAGLNVTRFYHIALFFLAPLCITGPIFVLSVAAKIKTKLSPTHGTGRILSKKLKKWWLFAVAILLMLFFLFQVGFVYEVTADSTPTSIALSKDRMDNWTLYLHQLYIEPQEVEAAQWLAVHGDMQTVVFGDFGAKYLNSYGFIPFENYHLLDPEVKMWVSSSNYFYFGAYNLAENKVEGMTHEWTMSDFAFVNNGTDKIYSNGKSEIFYGK
jgi:uncharacterized membrane protein